MRGPLFATVSIFCAAALAGCASDGYSSSSSVSVGTSFYYGAGWYGGTYYPYGPPGYVVVPPDYVDRPGQPGRPVGPEQPIAKPLPAQPSTRPAPSASTTSRMPSAQPRTSSPSSRASIPRAPRGGGMRR